MASRETVLRKRPLKTERVDTPELGEGEFVIVRELTARARDSFEAWAVANRNGAAIPPNIRAKLVSMSLVDEQGNLLLTPEDVTALGEQPLGWIDRVYDVASRMSGIGPREEAALQGKSAPGQDDGSSSV